MLLLAMAMFSIAGGHLFVLQTAAWSTMIVDLSRQYSLVEAAIKTFSGEAPCSMCKAVESGQRNQAELPASVKSDKKSETFTLAEPIIFRNPPAKDFDYPLPSDESSMPRGHQPPQPVPILAIV